MRSALLFLSFIALAFQAFAQQPTVQEKGVFTSTADFANFGYKYEHPDSFEKFTKTFFTEKSFQLDYTFRCTESGKQQLVIQQSIAIEANEKDADSTYILDEQNINHVTSQWLKYEGFANYYPCGKRWEYKLLTSTTNDKPTGFIYHYQKGKYTATLMVIGLFFDDPVMFKDFMEPLVKRTDEALVKWGMI